MSDLEERVERLEEEVGVEPMPTFDGWQMVEKVGEFHFLTVWRDSTDDGWIEDSDGEAACFQGDRTGGDLIEAIKESNR